MSSEIEVSVMGIKVRYKRVSKLPIALEPCKRVIKEKGTVRIRDEVIHCDIHGNISVKKI